MLERIKYPHIINSNNHINKPTAQIAGLAPAETTAISTDDHVQIETDKALDSKVIVDEAMEAVHLGGITAEAFEATGFLAGLSTMGIAGAGLYYAVQGVKDMKIAIREKNLADGIEAAGTLSAGGEALISTAGTLANIDKIGAVLGKAVTCAFTSPLALGLTSALGVVNGAVSTFIAGKHTISGIKNKSPKETALGLFELGTGLSIAAVSLGGGLPAGIALGVCFAGKLLLTNYQKIRTIPERVAHFADSLFSGKFHKSDKNGKSGNDIPEPGVVKEDLFITGADKIAGGSSLPADLKNLEVSQNQQTE